MEDPKYKEMNRMMLLSFLEILRSPDIRNDGININNALMVTVMEWIRDSDSVPAQRIKGRLLPKGKKRTGNADKSDDEIIINDLIQKQNQQTFRAAVAINAFIQVYRRVGEAFQATFIEELRSVGFINAGSFVQSILEGTLSQNKKKSQTIITQNSVGLRGPVMATLH